MSAIRPSEDQAARQILQVFATYKITAGNVLKRIHFGSVRDSDFQRGMDSAVANGWIARHPRDRYRYILTQGGRAAYGTLIFA